MKENTPGIRIPLKLFIFVCGRIWNKKYTHYYKVRQENIDNEFLIYIKDNFHLILDSLLI